MEACLQRIIAKYSSKWERNDPAHRQSHFDAVYQHGLDLNIKLDLNYPVEWILVAAYFHDLFTFDRETHHLQARVFVLTSSCEIITELLGDVHSEARVIVANACAEHRASFKGEYSHPFSDFFASADRGPVELSDTHVPKTVRRAFAYAQVTNPWANVTQLCQVTLEHMYEKFGTKGYMRMPKTYIQVYGRELDEVKSAFDALTLEDIILITQ